MEAITYTEGRPEMSDQIIDPLMARSLHDDAVRAHPLVAWIVTESYSEQSGKLLARLVAPTPSAYVLAADTLAELRAQLPRGLTRSEPLPGGPPGVVEMWFSPYPPGTTAAWSWDDK
jgi:hypothetical protein